MLRLQVRAWQERMQRETKTEETLNEAVVMAIKEIFYEKDEIMAILKEKFKMTLTEYEEKMSGSWCRESRSLMFIGR